MDDASSDFSDWEVLSAASAPGGDDDDHAVLVVAGQGGDVLHDHFALDDPSPPAAHAEGSWPEADDDQVQSALGSPDRFGSVSPGPPVDLAAVAGDSTAQVRLGGADVTDQASFLLAHGGATWTAQEEKTEEALGAETEAPRGCGESGSIPAHQGAEAGILDSGAAAPDGLGLEAENSSVQLEDSTVQLEDGGADSVTESSGLQAAAATGDQVHTAPEKGKDATSAASGCGELDGAEKDSASPLVAAASPVTGEGGERHLVVWWRLPFKLIHYCAWKVRPVWSISIAAAFLGIVVLGRRMYRMRRKTRALPQIKIAFDDKRASQFAERAARLNEAFLIAKRVPALRTPSGAALPWSMMQER